jgi:anti-sigma28 factor (negative regulator of flagellin synthesis)
MRVDDMSNLNITGSNLLKSVGASESSPRSSKVTTSSPSTEQAAATSYRGLLALAVQLAEPPQNSRVEELRRAIESGTYSTDLPGVGKAIVEAALNFD